MADARFYRASAILNSLYRLRWLRFVCSGIVQNGALPDPRETEALSLMYKGYRICNFLLWYGKNDLFYKKSLHKYNKNAQKLKGGEADGFGIHNGG